MFKKHSVCRACGNKNLTPVFSLGTVPLANDFKSDDEYHCGHVPLTVLHCEVCTLAQLSNTVSPEILYARNYPYVTSKSETMQRHFLSLWESIKSQSQAESVIEVGSNDGYFLEFARQNGADSVVGIDAAENLANIAINRGINTVIGILDKNTAKCASQVVPKADVIVARHVFCHADDWQKFMRSLDTLSNKDTLICIEVPYLVDTLQQVQSDQFYHEHLSYLSLKAMSALLETTSFRMQRVQRFPIHGGAIAIFIRRRDCGIEPDSSVKEFLDAENITLAIWELFAAKAKSRIDGLKYKLLHLMGKGGNVAGYGASAKSTVWISACGFTRKEISFVVDNTPQKQGKFIPGTDIPIVPESELTKADYAVCFAWNFWNEIVAKNKAWTGKFINPHE